MMKRFNLTQRETVLIIYLISLTLGFIATKIRVIDMKYGLIIFSIIVLISIFFGKKLDEVEIDY
jgi:hypothetical protein